MEGNTFRPIFFRYFIAVWLLYNFAAGSFHTTKLCSKKRCSRLYSTEVDLLKKRKKSLFEPPFGGLRGNIHTPSKVRWKARGRLATHHNWTFSLSFMVETLSGNLSKSAHHLVLSASLHVTDRQTNGRTDWIAIVISCIVLHAVAW